ncbi:copper amine oxidase N-terminal domain-containing protein [Brevibacillus reuszeri]|uniref:copper amine oxidase N-terminal domain-containing protein n=1 Tax=Brevibacillus reuszeri TaxID=54915 RepID=UPI0013E057BA|nr:copper amine oxidase N-terminal domain-containing protein [Brevibacillus reuszeri]
MKKSHMIAVSCLLATSLVTGTAAAQSDKYKESGKNTEASEKYEKKEKEKQQEKVEKEEKKAKEEQEKQQEKAEKEAKKAKEEQEKQAEKAEKEAKKAQEDLEKQAEKDAKEAKKAQEDLEKQAEKAAKEAKKAQEELDKQAAKKAKEEEKAAKKAATKSDTYGNYKKYEGLLKAIERVQDKPAGAAVAEMLKAKYEMLLSLDQQKQLGGVSEKDAALWAAAGILEKDGNLTDAASMGKEALRANYKDIEAYKKLGLLYKKLGKQNLGLYVNGEELEAAPILHNGRTLVPFRSISEALKAEVNWNPADKSVTVTRGGVVVKLIIDNKIAYVNGKEKVLDIPATLVEGTTVVPSRFVSEALNAEVQWEPETGAVIIIDKEATENTEASAATEASADAQ